ncbi:MAG: hypothetical protein PHX13_03490 [Thiovulaceae bacterium]|nr:hypothetical protein [Sulfurimonadaceae bacterium]
MDSVTNSQAPVAAQVYAMKKSREVDAQSMAKILDSATTQSKNIQDAQAQQMQQSTAQKTGLGQSLDLKV